MSTKPDQAQTPSCSIEDQNELMPLQAGIRLGHYDVTALIGEGGMGQVYRATDTQLGRTR